MRLSKAVSIGPKIVPFHVVRVMSSTAALMSGIRDPCNEEIETGRTTSSAERLMYPRCKIHGAFNATPARKLYPSFGAL